MDMHTITKSLDSLEGKLKLLPELADRVLTLEQTSTMKSAPPVGGTRGGLGSRVWTELDKNRELLSKTKQISFEVKAAGDPVTTGSARNLVVGLIGGPGVAGVLGLQNALVQTPSGGVSAIEYSRYTGKQGAAGQQATEGAAKSYVRPDHTLVMQKALTIAGLTKISRQAMTDRAELVAVIETILAREVGIALDAALCNGATDFTGGFEALATAYTSLVYTALVDAISEGVATMQAAGFVPNTVALNPNDWLSITVAKGTDGHYLSGAYLAAMPQEMRALRVVLSPSVDAGKALLLDTTHAELRVSDAFTVEIAYSGTDFESNLATIRGETRVIPIFRTVGAARLITPKP